MVRPGVSPNVGLFHNLFGETMARIEKRVTNKQKAFVGTFPFTKLNYQILGVGILCIVLGYIALAQDPWDGTMPLVVAPILLVLGYCVVIPIGILFRKHTKENVVTPPIDATAENSH
jgi:hypothetical protein